MPRLPGNHPPSRPSQLSDLIHAPTACVSHENAPGARLAWLEENTQKFCTEVARRPSLTLEEQLVILAADRSPDVSGQLVRTGIAAQHFDIQWASGGTWSTAKARLVAHLARISSFPCR
jgi:hypothetical protein